MMLWVNFAAIVDPNGKGLPVWPSFRPEAKDSMQPGYKNRLSPVASDARFEIFKRFFACHPPKCSFASDCKIDMQ
jgi:carboxylesterase type B